MQCAERVDHRAELALDDRVGLPGLALGQRLADADDRRQAVRRAPAGLVGDELHRSRRVARAARNGRRSRSAAELGQHRRRDLAGEGAAVVAEQSCAPQAMALPCSASAHLARGTAPARRPRRSAGERRRRACSAVEQRLVGRQAAVHLPVADDQLARGVMSPWLTRSAPSCRCAGSIPSARAPRRLARPGTPVDHRLDARRSRATARPCRAAPRRSRALNATGRGRRVEPVIGEALAQHQAGIDLRLDAALHRDDHQPAVFGQAARSRARRSRRRPCRG